MRIENFFSYYKNELKARPEGIKNAIANGVKDWDTYRYMVGRYNGLKEAEQELADLLEKTELEDD